jgi:C4-dicarboxylate-specific signal transduction histidine kinase
MEEAVGKEDLTALGEIAHTISGTWPLFARSHDAALAAQLLAATRSDDRPRSVEYAHALLAALAHLEPDLRTWLMENPAATQDFA